MTDDEMNELIDDIEAIADRKVSMDAAWVMEIVPESVLAEVCAVRAAAPPPRAPLTEADLPQHPYGGPSPGLVWTVYERSALLAWGNALLGIKPAGDGT